MKKILLAMSLLCMTLSANANSAKKNTLVGIWQQVQFDSKAGHFINLPVWKVLENDGSFHVFLIADPKCQCIITNQGKYTVKTDSTFVEHVTGSITDATLVGRNNTITYHFDGQDKMRVTYQMPSATSKAEETWVRVKLEMPK